METINVTKTDLFKSMISHDKTLKGRAERLVLDIHDSMEKALMEARSKVRKLEGVKADMLDFGADSIHSLKVKNVDADQWTAAFKKACIELEESKIELLVLEDQYKEIFNIKE